MRPKTSKTQTDKELEIERVLYTKRYALTLDKELCKGCGICAQICPREAIEVKKVPKVKGEKAKPPTIDIDELECDYCGICDPICPFGAIKIQVDGEHVIPVVTTESFPRFIRKFEVDNTKCEVGCSDCEKSCPLDLITVRSLSPLQRAREIILSKKNKDGELSPLVNVAIDSCPGCGLCVRDCPQDAIRARKIFLGSIRINHQKCPEGCQDCLDVCPFPGALYLGEDNKVHTNESYCVYCGTCKVVCPEKNALDLRRTYIHHTPVRSGAWNRALEKLTSTKGLTKELQARSTLQVKELVKKRLG